MVNRAKISGKERSHIRTLMNFVTIFCRENHDETKSPFLFRPLDIKQIEEKEIALCQECTRLLTYALTMRLKCPHNPKPMCKKCETQCYRGDYKDKIREVMKFSGLYLVKHGRVDMLYHYLR